MKKLKFSIVSVSILLSFGLFAQEQGTSLYNEAKNDVNKDVNYKASDSRSKLRNKNTLSNLENKILDEDIDRIQKELKLKKLRFNLDKVPAEYLDNVDNYLEKEYFSKKEGVTKYPVINKSINGNSSYPIETYAIDQQILIPHLKATKKNKKEIRTTGNVMIVDTPILDVPKEVSLPKDVFIEEPTIVVKSQQEQQEQQQQVAAKTVTEELDLTPEEQKQLDMILEGMDKQPIVIKTKKDVLEKLVEEKDYSEVKSAVIERIFIFGDDKSVNLSLAVYVGDGVEGETYKDKLTNVKEGQIIAVKGYNYKINNISFTEVEIENLEDNKVYVASKSLRNID